MPPFLAALAAAIAAQQAAQAFAPEASVTLEGLIPGKPGDQWEIDRATAWAVDRAERRGRASRRVYEAENRVTFEFEDERDAIEFRLLFV